MQKIASVAMAALLVMSASLSYSAAVPSTPVPPSTSSTPTHVAPEAPKLVPVRLEHARAASMRHSETRLESNTGVMLVGAIAIMGVMVRRRWRSR